MWGRCCQKPCSHQNNPCLVCSGGTRRAFPGKGPGTGHKGSIFPGKPRGAWSRQLPGRRLCVLPEATATAARGPRCLLPPGCCAMPRCWLGPLEKLPAACSLSFLKTRLQNHGRVLSLPSRCCTNTSRAGCPTGTKSAPGQSLSPRSPPAELCQRSPSSIPAPSRPWQHHSQRGREPRGVGNAGFPARRIPPRAKHRLWPAAGRGPGADGCSLPVLALPLCTSLVNACQLPGVAFLNPFTVKSSSCPAAAPSALCTLGRGGEEGPSTSWGDRGLLWDHQWLVAGEFPIFLWAPVKGTQNPRRWEGPSGFQLGFWGQAQ